MGGDAPEDGYGATAAEVPFTFTGDPTGVLAVQQLAEPVDAGVASVRPYVLTGGRTRADRYLGLETLVSTHWPLVDPRGLANPAHQSVIDLCDLTKSVAEVAALMQVPLGVARVLIGDLAQIGALFVHHQPTADGFPDAGLMARVLSGLQRL